MKKLAQGFNTAAQDSNPGSRSRGEGGGAEAGGMGEAEYNRTTSPLCHCGGNTFQDTFPSFVQVVWRRCCRVTCFIVSKHYVYRWLV